MADIVLGVSSSISAYKAIDIVDKLKSKGHDVEVIMTANALKLVKAGEFDCRVHSDLFVPGLGYQDYLERDITHVSLADKADLFMIVPATANVIGKIANGIADDLLTTSVMATNAPVLVCPAMNSKMWGNQVVQENVSRLSRLGYRFVMPAEGMLACGYEGVGRLAGADDIINEAEDILARANDLNGVSFMVTAGATSEEIDAVRVITNKSSGKMGVAIAEEAARRGADVTLVRGINSVSPRASLKDVKVVSAKDMLEAVTRNNHKDVVVHAAAVSDFTVDRKDTKIKSGQPLNLELTPTAKILENIKAMNPKVFLVGFKAEYNVSDDELVDRAYYALKQADADLIVANDVGKEQRGFDVDTNEVFVVDRDRNVRHYGLDTKRKIASAIIDEILKRFK